MLLRKNESSLERKKERKKEKTVSLVVIQNSAIEC